MFKIIKSIEELGNPLPITHELNKLLADCAPDEEPQVLKYFAYIHNFLAGYGNKYFESYKTKEAGEIGIIITAYQMLEQEYAQVFKDKKPTCYNSPRGCFHCCYINVDVTDAEIKLLLQYVDDNKVPIDWERVERIAKLAPGLEAYRELPYDDRRCVFLGVNNVCTVYDARPLLCRTHFVASRVELCDTKDKTYRTMDYGIMAPEIIKSCINILFKLQSGTILNLAATLLKLKDYTG